MIRLLFVVVLACSSPVLHAQDGDRAARRALTMSELISQEKRAPTTAKNVRQRHDALGECLRRGGGSERYLPRRTAMRIRALLDEGKEAEAAKLVHSAILRIEKEGLSDDGGDPAEKRSRDYPTGQVSPPQDNAGRDGMRTLRRLVGEENRSPTTERNVESRREELIGAAFQTKEVARYLPLGTMGPVDALLAQGKRKEAAVKLRAIILGIRGRLPSGEDGREDGPNGGEVNAAVLKWPPAKKGGEDEPTVVSVSSSIPTAADKAGAAALYFKAMQEYANDKKDRAWEFLQSGAKLDPGNQDIVKAIERLAKER